MCSPFFVDVNVALGKPTEQLSDLEYIWIWSSDKAVDGCNSAANPNDPTAQCCATSEGFMNNYWKVYLLNTYLVHRIAVYSRGDGK